MDKNRLLDSVGTTVVQERRVLAKTPKGLGAKLVATRTIHDDPVSELLTHVVQEQVCVRMDQTKSRVE